MEHSNIGKEEKIMKKPLLLELETLGLFFFSVAVLRGQYISFPCPPGNPSLSFKGLFLASSLLDLSSGVHKSFAYAL